MGVNVGTPILRAIAWPAGIPKFTWRMRLREANDWTPSAGKPGGSSTRPWKQHQWSGEFAVNPLVGTEISIAEIEECLPVNKPASRALPAAQIVRVLGVVEDKCKERRSTSWAKVDAVTGKNL